MNLCWCVWTDSVEEDDEDTRDTGIEGVRYPRKALNDDKLSISAMS